MLLKILCEEFSVSKIHDIKDVDYSSPFTFVAKTDDEISLVSPISSVPLRTIERDDGWRAFRIEGVLDFSLIGILSKISNILKENAIPIFAISTYNTDYILVRKENFLRALNALKDAGYEISEASN